VNRALIEAAVTRLSDCDGLNSERMAHLGRHPPDRTGVFARREVLIGKIQGGNNTYTNQKSLHLKYPWKSATKTFFGKA